MKDELFFLAFFETVAEDPRIGPGHIAVYLALRTLWAKSGSPAWVEIYSRTVMQLAKIKSRDTYRKHMHELTSFKYIDYEPANDLCGTPRVRFRRLM